MSDRKHSSFLLRQLSGGGFLIVLGLVLLTVAYRLASSHFGFPGNTAPLMATAFGGAFLLGIRFWWVPALALISSDILLGFWNGGGGIGGYTLMSAGFIFAVCFVGANVRRFHPTWIGMWCGTLICSMGFYVVANTYSWLAWPGYEKSLAGWLQSQTTGVPGIQPQAWTFLRNAMIADTLWCMLAGVLFFASYRVFPSARRAVADSR